MKTTTKEEESPTKKEANSSDGKTSKASSSSTWLRLKDPRIVRVSRALGGKDRHSKVCTIRGLRDRRVRLSVPTAIQLYDLQDRLGLNQPSKVVDWLLNAAKHEIDELPPLPIPPMNLALTHQTMLTSSQETGSNSQSNKHGCKINSSIYWEDQDGLTRPILWSNDSDLLRAKSKQVARDSTVNEKENDQQESNQVPSISLYHRASQSSSSGLISNTLPYGSFFQLDHPSFQSSHFAGSHGFASHADLDIHNQNSVPLPSTLSPSSSSQILVRPPPGAAPQPYFPAHFSLAAADIDPRQMNHFQMFTSTTQNLFPNSLITPTPYSLNQSGRPFHFNIAPRLFNAHIEGSDQPADKDQDFPCK